MRQVIKDQIITTTSTDSYGDALTEEELRTFFDQITPDLPIGQLHDLSKPPLFKILDKHLKRLDNGILAITIDLEIYDIDAMREFQGFSIGFTRKVFQYGQGNPQCRIQINPHQFNLDHARELLRKFPPAACFEVSESPKKAFLSGGVIAVAIIAIIMKCSWAFVDGFFKKAGADSWDALRKGLTRKDAPGEPITLHFEIPSPPQLPVSKCLIVMSPEIPSEALQKINFTLLHELITQLASESPINRIVLDLLPDGSLRLRNIIH